MNFIRLQGLAAGTVSGRNNGLVRCYVEFGVRAKTGFSILYFFGRFFFFIFQGKKTKKKKSTKKKVASESRSVSSDMSFTFARRMSFAQMEEDDQEEELIRRTPTNRGEEESEDDLANVTVQVPCTPKIYIFFLARIATMLV